MKFFIFVFLFLFSGSCMAGEIIATVNDSPISSYDTEARAKLMALQKSQKLTSRQKKEFSAAALQALIDDQIKINEAQKNGFYVSDEEINQAITHLENQNQLKQGQMLKMLSQNGIPAYILKNQIKADLLWLQVIQKHKNALVEPTAAEIEKRKNVFRNQLKEEGFYVAEILIPDAQEAEKCFKELHTGIPFDELAKKYSKSKSAQNGGEVGWVKNGKYSKEIFTVLRQMGTGDVSAPLKTPDGYLILLLLDRKYAILTDTIPVWELAQMALPANKTAALGNQITQLNTCSAFMSFAHKEAIPESVKSGMVSPDQLPQELKKTLVKEKVNRIIGPIQTPDFDLFFMKCMVTNKQVLPTNEEIQGQLESEKMEVLSQKLLKNAKRFAVVEYKK